MTVGGDPAHEAHERFKKQFGSDEVLSVAIPFADAFSSEALDLQRRVAERISHLESVLDVDALVTEDDVIGAGSELFVRPLVPSDDALKREGRKTKGELEKRVREHPIWQSWLISKDLSTIAFQVRLEDSASAEVLRAETIAEIDQVLKKMLGAREYFLAGHPFMKYEITQSIGNDLAALLPITFSVMVILLFAITRSVLVGIATAFSMILAVVWMIGTMGWFGLGITALSNASPTILMALATAYFLHFVAAYQSARTDCSKAAVEYSIERVSRPMWVAAITTSIGYGSLSLSSVPIVREFGRALAVGVLATGVVGSFVLPSLLCLAPGSVGAGALSGNPLLPRGLFAIASVVSRAPRVLLTGFLLFGLVMVWAASGIEVDSSGPGRFDEESRFRASSRFYRDQLSGDVLESVYLTGSRGAFLDPSALSRVQAFQNAALELPAVDKTISIADYVARIHWVFGGEVGDPAALPLSANAVSQLLLLYESSSDLDSLSDFISADRSAIRIMLKANVQSSKESAQLRRDLDFLADRFFPSERDEHSVVSTEMLLSKAADVIAVEQVRSALVAVVLVLAVITVSFGSLRAGLLMIFPNILPLATNLGVMAILGMHLSDATSIITATAIGIAVDSTVHLLSSATVSEVRLRSSQAAVIYALVSTGRAVVLSALVISIGFSVLLYSNFRSVAELGALTALTMIYCLVADLLILPAQLLLRKSGQVPGVAVYLEFSRGVGVGVGQVSDSELVLEDVLLDPRVSPDSERIEQVRFLDSAESRKFRTVRWASSG
jgi:predicted RND superfamily exporter protein